MALKTKPFPWHHATYYDTSLSPVENVRRYLIKVFEMVETRKDEVLEVYRRAGRHVDDSTLESACNGAILEQSALVYHMNYGVVVHVDDPELLRKVHASTLPDALTLEDIRPPYPIMEIRFSDGTPAVLYTEYGYQGLADFVAEVAPAVRFAPVLNNDVDIITMTENKSDKNPSGVCGSFFSKSAPLNAQFKSTARTISTVEELEITRQAFSAGVLAMMLRMDEIKGKFRQHLPAVPGKLARKLCSRRNFRVNVPDLYSPQRDNHPSGMTLQGDRKGVEPHWRRSHYRVLLAPCYKRDENGRVRIVEVSAAAVHGGDKKEVKV